MALFSIHNVKLIGVSACVPKNEVSNWDYDVLSKEEQKILIKTTGIEKKRIADK
jgi:3-oxoacyl-[acyl-carrier-protein] synthase III